MEEVHAASRRSMCHFNERSMPLHEKGHGRETRGDVHATSREGAWTQEKILSMRRPCCVTRRATDMTEKSMAANEEAMSPHDPKYTKFEKAMPAHEKGHVHN
ncbi:unnamed protein product [Linum trigynum]|uniref:Uncharacterized protein n=1 Tax=Linum trigynum TaxID=586398 RepID=A0AAV2E677_9ROSI